jgi:YD repeat-containing protein
MSTRSSFLIFMSALAICLLLGLIMGMTSYFFSPAQKSLTGATNGPHAVAQPPNGSASSDAGVSSQSADTTPSPQPQVSSESVPVYKYNPQGQLAAIIYPDGSIYSYRYDANGDKISETDRSGQTWVYLYAPSDQTITIIDPKGQVTHKEMSSNTVQVQK